jgi:transposase
VIGTSRTARVWAYPAPVDLRRGFDGLEALVTGLRRSALTGDYFLFTNRTRRSAKVLVWDGTGLLIYHKRLERGQFACLWNNGSSEPVELTVSELALFLEGCRLIGQQRLSPTPVVLASRAA